MFQRLKTFFEQLKTQSSAFYQGLTRARKMSLLAAFVGLLVVMLGFAIWSPDLQMEPVYSNLSPDDKNAILRHFKTNNIKDFKMEGDTLYFPEEKTLDYKMQLAQENLPSSGEGVGWEKFDEQAFGLTDFDQRVNKLRAIQGELAKTINKLDPIESSRVHIVLPESAVFEEDKKATTASIFIRLKRGKTLTQRQIQGIVHLAARAVEGLDVNNIAVIDQDGNMLTQPEDQDDGFDRVNTAQRDAQRKMEKELEGKIRDILGRVVGHNKVIAKVQADLDFKKVETTIQDVDPERRAIIAQQTSEQSSNGSGLNPTGVPGAKSNLPGEKEDVAQAGGSSMGSKQSNELVNFEVKKTLSKIIEPQGNVKKLSTAVLVDGKMVEGNFTERTPQEIEKITLLVKNAIGFQDGRDSITVQSTYFEPDEMAMAEQTALTARKTSLIQTGIVSTVALAGILFFYFAVVKPYFKWLTFDPNKRSQEQFGVVEYELERSGEAAKRVQVQEEVPFEKLSPKEQILYLAKHDPKKTTEAIRQFLSPQHS